MAIHSQPTGQPRSPTAVGRKQGSLTFRYRIGRFVFFNIIVAFIPVALSVIFYQLGAFTISLDTYAPEFLFFSVIFSATVLGDICDELYRGGRDGYLLLFLALLALALIVAACLYGAYQFSVIFRAQTNPFRNRITTVSVVLSMLICLAGSSVELLLARAQQAAIGQTPTTGTGGT